MTVKVEGLDEAIRALNRLAGESWVNGPLREYGKDVMESSRPYIPNRGYRRTGDLGDGWYMQPGDKRVTIGNRVPYSGYVQQRSTQAYMHKGYWHTVEDKGESEVDVFWRAVEREVRRIFG